MTPEEKQVLSAQNAALNRWAFGPPQKQKPSKRQALLAARKAELRKRLFPESKN